MSTIRFLGHAAFELVTAKGTRIYFDPWITGNPQCPVTVAQLDPADIVLISHDHGDHIGEDLAVLSHEDTVFPAQPELIARLEEQGASGGMGMNIGGTVSIKDVQITMVQAYHSSGVGTPCGFIVTTDDGEVVYHAGDTGIFAEMEIFGDLYDIDLALLPIGDVFVMGARQAARAAGMLRAQQVIPMHYGTFPVLDADTIAFEEWVGLEVLDIYVHVLAPGDSTSVH